MALIFTTKGMVEEGDLSRVDGFVDNDHEHTTWTEYRDASGEIVRRDVHVTLKEGLGIPLFQQSLG